MNNIRYLSLYLKVDSSLFVNWSVSRYWAEEAPQEPAQAKVLH